MYKCIKKMKRIRFLIGVTVPIGVAKKYVMKIKDVHILKCKVFFKKLGGMKVRRQHLSVIFANSLPFVFLNFVSLVLVCYQKNQSFYKTTLSFVIEPNIPDCFLSRTKTTFLFIPKRGSPKNTKHLLLNFISVTVSKWPKSVQSSTMASGIS
jgi:hypothetical protein